MFRLGCAVFFKWTQLSKKKGLKIWYNNRHGCLCFNWDKLIWLLMQQRLGDHQTTSTYGHVGFHVTSKVFSHPFSNMLTYAHFYFRWPFCKMEWDHQYILNQWQIQRGGGHGYWSHYSANMPLVSQQECEEKSVSARILSFKKWLWCCHHHGYVVASLRLWVG